MTSHAAVVGRQMGKPSVVGAGAIVVNEKAKQFSVGGTDDQGRRLAVVRRPDRGSEVGAVASKPSEILQVSTAR